MNNIYKKITVTSVYKLKKGGVVINYKDRTGMVTTLATKPTRETDLHAIAIWAIKDFIKYNTGSSRHITVKFVNEPNAEEDSTITYFETCYGWDL